MSYPMLQTYLEDLERRINPEIEDHVLAQWTGFWNRSVTEGYFTPTRIPVPSKLEWPRVNINDAIAEGRPLHGLVMSW